MVRLWQKVKRRKCFGKLKLRRMTIGQNKSCSSMLLLLKLAMIANMAFQNNETVFCRVRNVTQVSGCQSHEKPKMFHWGTHHVLYEVTESVLPSRSPRTRLFSMQGNNTRSSGLEWRQDGHTGRRLRPRTLSTRRSSYKYDMFALRQPANQRNDKISMIFNVDSQTNPVLWGLLSFIV